MILFVSLRLKLDDLDILESDDFLFKYKNRQKLAAYKSEGIAIGYKKYLEKYVKPIETDCQYVYWLNIDKHIFNLSQNVIIGVIYIPPVNSIYSSDEAYAEIEIELQRFVQTTKNIILAGDFNSRTANLLDFYDIEDDNVFENAFLDQIEPSCANILDELNLPKVRTNPDKIVNNFGRKMLDFCKNNKMLILNGRIDKDKNGKPTSIFSSVIDYRLVSSIRF